MVVSICIAKHEKRMEGKMCFEKLGEAQQRGMAEFRVLSQQQRIEALEPLFAPFFKSKIIKGAIPNYDDKAVVTLLKILGIVDLDLAVASHYPNLKIAWGLLTTDPKWSKAPAWLDLVAFYRALHNEPNWPLRVREWISSPSERSKELTKLFKKPRSSVHVHFGGQTKYDRKKLSAVSAHLVWSKPNILFSIGPLSGSGDSAVYNPYLIELFLEYGSLPKDQRGRVVGVLLPKRQEHHPWARASAVPPSPHSNQDLVEVTMTFDPLHHGGQNSRATMEIFHPLAIALSLGITARDLIYTDGGQWFVS